MPVLMKRKVTMMIQLTDSVLESVVILSILCCAACAVI